jgi:hypothetical protein
LFFNSTAPRRNKEEKDTPKGGHPFRSRNGQENGGGHVGNRFRALSLGAFDPKHGLSASVIQKKVGLVAAAVVRNGDRLDGSGGDPLAVAGAGKF